MLLFPSNYYSSFLYLLPEEKNMCCVLTGIVSDQLPWLGSNQPLPLSIFVTLRIQFAREIMKTLSPFDSPLVGMLGEAMITGHFGKNFNSLLLKYGTSQHLTL